MTKLRVDFCFPVPDQVLANLPDRVDGKTRLYWMALQHYSLMQRFPLLLPIKSLLSRISLLCTAILASMLLSAKRSLS
jgi:hypothetical protein